MTFKEYPNYAALLEREDRQEYERSDSEHFAAAVWADLNAPEFIRCELLTHTTVDHGGCVLHWARGLEYDIPYDTAVDFIERGVAVPCVGHGAAFDIELERERKAYAYEVPTPKAPLKERTKYIQHTTAHKPPLKERTKYIQRAPVERPASDRKRKPAKPKSGGKA